MPPIICVVGKSASGKTTLMVKLIRELKERGYKVGTIKHAHHGFDVDRQGKDSWRHKEAGADTVVVAATGRIAMVKDEPCESLDGLAAYFPDMDIIIAEGYKRAPKPKIEIFRPESHKSPLGLGADHLIAFVSDAPIEVAVPKFALEDIAGLADLLEQKYL